ncbi:MAG: glycosyltransferase family 39 protein [Nitrospirae bacterium]|nr:glycosyltransferase family 39 protein [Nitrospirota bacterium]
MNRNSLAALGTAFLFLLPRWLGLGQSYYQDDAKIPLIVDPAFGRQGANPHPPLGEALQAGFGAIAGYDHLRWLPFLFSAGNLLLVYRLARTWAGPAAAGWAAFVLAATFYSILGSTMLDVDGAIMPFFGLLAMLSYSKGRDTSARTLWRSQIPTALACAAGLLLKFIFLLVPAALVLDAFLSRPKLNRDRLQSFLLPVVVGTVAFGAGLALLRLLYGGSDVTHAIEFASGFEFFRFDRISVAHKAFEFIKCLLYASPWVLICLPALRPLWRTARPAFLFILLYVLVHAVVLRLEGRAIDRYFGMTVPFAAVLTGIAASNLLPAPRSWTRKTAAGLLVPAALAILPLIFLIPAGRIIPLYPKTGFVSALARGDWTTLIPFRGGNGPAGFYIPMGFAVISWLLASLSLAVLVLSRGSRIRITCLLILVFLGFSYNAVFAEEFALGLRYGNPSRLANRVLGEVTSMRNVPRVITYDDIGLYELSVSRQYAGRFYGVPEYWESNRKKLAAARDARILVVHFPILDPHGPYWRYLSGCLRLREWRHRRMEAFLADCSGAALP